MWQRTHLRWRGRVDAPGRGGRDANRPRGARDAAAVHGPRTQAHGPGSTRPRRRRCVRCHTRYCDAACQHEHWANGHKKKCKKIARAGGAEQFYANTKAKEAADVAVAKCALFLPAGATCSVCQDQTSTENLVRACTCGVAHLSCLVRRAQVSVSDNEANVTHYGSSADWQRCPTCKNDFDPTARLPLKWACWKTYLSRGEGESSRFAALVSLSYALHAEEQYKDALPFLRYSLDVRQRLFGMRVGYDKLSEGDPILEIEALLADTCYNLKNYHEALTRYRDARAHHVSAFGAAHRNTLQVCLKTAGVLVALDRRSEARDLLSKQLSLARNEFGEEDAATIQIAKVLYLCLKSQSGSHPAGPDELREAKRLDVAFGPFR